MQTTLMNIHMNMVMNMAMDILNSEAYINNQTYNKDYMLCVPPWSKKEQNTREKTPVLNP